MPASKPLTPAEIAALEHAFASDPGSDAWRPLAEAYLAMGRFMEAMVVCKKGVKANPAEPAARVLLARVYAEQGKDRKALEEVQAALQEHPGDAAGNRLAGVLHLKLGEREPGEAALRRAAEAAPGDPETQDALKKWGVTAAAPAPQPARPARSMAEGIPVAPRVGPRGAAPPVAPRVPGQAPPSARAPAPAAPRQAGPGRNVAYAQELADKYGTQEFHLS
ncbi:MAG TPA: tetratricopeptide repeat protein, partial [Anaeromyxobacteraceae bacterium]